MQNQSLEGTGSPVGVQKKVATVLFDKPITMMSGDILRINFDFYEDEDGEWVVDSEIVGIIKEDGSIV